VSASNLLSTRAKGDGDLPPMTKVILSYSWIPSYCVLLSSIPRTDKVLASDPQT
jgi:hypothetical protein